MDQQLSLRITRLEVRLDAIEQRLGLIPGQAKPLPIASVAATPAPVDTAVAPSRLDAAHPAFPAQDEVAPVTPVASVAAVTPAAPMRTAMPPPLPTLDRLRARREPTAAPTLTYASQTQARVPVVDGSLEQTIGLKWAGWIGSVVLVVAAGMGVKFAYDNGWFGGMPASLKLLIMWLVSATLLALGEWVYRRVNALSAAGLFGAGVACMFLVSYSGHGFLSAYDKNTAFVLMAMSTLVGAAVAMRGRMVSVAVLALIGGNIAPLAVGGSEPSNAFLFYILMLQLTALVLAWWGGSPRWWMLRGLSLATTIFWSAVMLAGNGSSPLLFFIIFAALYHAELIISTAQQRAGQKVGVLFSALVTAAMTVGLLLLYRDATPMLRGGLVCAVAVASTALGWMLRLRTAGAERAPLRQLSEGYLIQAITLLVIAVPIALTGWGVVAGWAALATAFAALGVQTGRSSRCALGLGTWLAAVGYFAIHVAAGWKHLASAEAFAISGTSIPQYLLVAGALVIVGQLVAWLATWRLDNSAPNGHWLHGFAQAALAVGGVAWAITAIIALPPLGATVALLVYALWCATADTLSPRLKLAWHSAGAIAAAMVKWAVVDMVAGQLSAVRSAAPVVWNPSMGVGALIAVSLVGLWWWKRRTFAAAAGRDDARFGALEVAVGVIVLMGVGLSFEAHRAVQLAAAAGPLSFPPGQTSALVLTLLWTAVAAALVAVFRLIRPAVNAMPLGAAAVLLLACKFVAIDFLPYRLAEGPAAVAVAFNLQALACLCLFALMLLAISLYRRHATPAPVAKTLLGTGAVVLAWLAVSIEIDRWAATQAPVWIARQVGFSVWWSVYAVVLIVAGFRLRVAALRYAGLALFGVTLGKVVLIDLSTAAKGLRILSFFGLGALLLATSVLYGKLSPRLLNARSKAPSDT